jgi:fatty-acyl-CoA synthase
MFIPLSPLRCLHRALDLYGKKEGVICGAKRFTYREFGERCERLATGLTALGIHEGDRAACLSFNTHRLLEAYYGVVQARAIVMPLNIRLAPAELIGILRHSEANTLLFETDFAPIVDQIRKVCPAIQRYVCLDGAHPLAELTYEDVLQHGRPERANVMRIDESAPAELFYTSGSTGMPKGVVLSHRTLYLQAMQVASILGDDSTVDLHTIPLFHANGWSRPQVCTMLGMKQVMVRRFDPLTVFRLIQEERATTMSLVPIMAGALLTSPDREKFDLSSMKEIHIGGAASSPELIARMETAFQASVTAGYGLTETSPVATDARQKSTITYASEQDRLRRLSMAGWPIPGVEVRVVDSEMHDVPRDMSTMGEIVIRGDNVMDGYFRESGATEAVMSGAWFHTGDMAVWDEDNYVHIVDRKKDIIISGGENISSIEVEKAISAHPAVLECAVVGAPDPKWGEAPVAFVVPKPGETIHEELLIAFLAERLARFKMPRSWYFQTELLPKTGTGKVLKRELREQFWKDKAERVQG